MIQGWIFLFFLKSFIIAFFFLFFFFFDSGINEYKYIPIGTDWLNLPMELWMSPQALVCVTGHPFNHMYTQWWFMKIYWITPDVWLSITFKWITERCDLIWESISKHFIFSKTKSQWILNYSHRDKSPLSKIQLDQNVFAGEEWGWERENRCQAQPSSQTPQAASSSFPALMLGPLDPI